MSLRPSPDRVPRGAYAEKVADRRNKFIGPWGDRQDQTQGGSVRSSSFNRGDCHG